MEEDIKTEVIKLYNKLDEVGWKISGTKQTLEDLEIKLKDIEEVLKDLEEITLEELEETIKEVEKDEQSLL